MQGLFTPSLCSPPSLSQPFFPLQRYVGNGEKGLLALSFGRGLGEGVDEMTRSRV